MAFFQSAPALKNQYEDDALLVEYLDRILPEPVRRRTVDEFRHLGERAMELYALQLEDRTSEPEFVPYDAWGHRIDRVKETEVWKRGARLAAEHGFVAAGYEPNLGPHARIHQFTMNYLVQASLDVHSCPLAMTDGAARTLLDLNPPKLVDRAVSRLLSRDPERMWTSGQWMTERTGGSDVGSSETIARPADDPTGDFRLFGTKWFTSAVSADMALTLARPEGRPLGGRNLALFYVEVRDARGRLNGISINRLKDKLGTRKVPTAELTLDGAVATPVRGLENGTRHIASMLNVTRTWNAVAAAWLSRRCLALAKDYARRRIAFGDTLNNKPLHIDTLAGLEAEREGVFHLAFRTVELLGRVEAGTATDAERELLRIVTPVAKLTTAKQTVAIASETLESFGGAGYVEDTGLPLLLRDSQVLPIWEGTTNVLSLDTLRALASGSGSAVAKEIDEHLQAVQLPALKAAKECVQSAVRHAEAWLSSVERSPVRLEAGARRYAMTLGRTLELAYLCHHAQHCPEGGARARATAAARRFARHGVDLIDEGHAPDESEVLLQ